MLLELSIGAHLTFFRRHTDVALIDQQRFFATCWACMAEGIAIFWSPHLRAEDARRGVLYYTSRPSWDTLPSTITPVHIEAIEVSVAKSLVGDADLPVAIVINSLELPHGHRLPVIEGADEMDALSPRKELTKYPATFLFIVVKTIIKVAIGKLL